MARIIVEHVFEGPAPDEGVTKKLDGCLEQRGAAWRRSYTSKDGKRMTCEFEAETARAVEDAYREAAVPFVAAWEADLADVDDYPEQYERLERVLERRRQPGSVH